MKNLLVVEPVNFHRVMSELSEIVC